MLRGLLTSIVGYAGHKMGGQLMASSRPAVGLATQISWIHTSVATHNEDGDRSVPKRWPDENKKLYQPQEPGEERRPAWVCHYRTNIKYSPKKMWYIASMIRGKTIDEALKQLSFVSKKGSQAVMEVLLEAQQMAVEQENIEYKSNLWIGESFVGKGVYVRGLRRHARRRFGKVEYKHCHYFVRLVEGSPPPDYYPKEPTGNEKLMEYLDEWRQRRIVLTL